MKEITRIHLAKTPFSVEVDAKKSLEQYLDSIQKNMHAEPEAMREIEARMVELLAERGVSKDGVISHDDILVVQQQMGEPQDFADGEMPETVDTAETNANKPTKRLMRDPDNAILGGVCAGIAAYWGINPLWVRLLFIFSPFITFGTSLLIYIVLWISMPEAQTAAEKLQMRGEEVTLDSLKNFSFTDNKKTQVKNTFIKIVQVITSFVLIMITFGLLVAVPVGLFAGASVISWMDGFAAQPWALGLLISALVGGAAAVTLFGVLTSSAIKWHFTRTALIAVIISTVIGAFCISSSAIFGTQTLRELARDEERLTKTMTVELPKSLEGVKYADVTSNGLVSRQAIPSQETKIEVKYFSRKDGKAPKVQAIVEGDTLKINIEHDSQLSCLNESFFWGVHCGGITKVTVYGPLQLKPYSQDIDDFIPYRGSSRTNGAFL
ncbi:MAG: PspC domain-containing protein [Candidatus Saccharimonas sp.]|nr:MAG: PspC domain-containing protein [Candidatus Saccharimonas sp.]